MNAETDRRPSPDALLQQAVAESRGRLKIYLGAAPGVGKTYAMLEAARRRQAEGADVLVGLVETHGRRETASLLDGLSVLPRRAVPYEGHVLEEFDLDAALARKPGLILVDELAHTNAEGSRHPKRHQDVDELLEAGIDVWTTLNIQHLESLNDVVARITHVQVRETVPDHVLEQAAEVELVDLTPEELAKRLADGRVYVAHLADRARDNFFRPGNLSALRELALRRVAQRVDDQMVDYMQAHAIDGPWAAGERLMVLVGDDAAAATVVRAGARLADQLKAPWIAVHAESGVSATTGKAAAALALAERLGARTARLVAANAAPEIMRHARRNNVTQIVLGRPRRRLRHRFQQPLQEALAGLADGVALHLVPTAAPSPRKDQKRWNLPALPHLSAILIAVLGIGAVVACGTLLPDLRSQPNVGMLFLAVVLANAVRHGLYTALGTALLAFLAYNFFFTEPLFTLNVSHWHDVLALIVFLGVAATTGILAGRVRDQVAAARARMAALQTLYDFARRLGQAKTQDALLHAVVLQAHRLTGRAAIILLPGPDGLGIRYSWPPEDAIGDIDRGAANWSVARAEPAGAHTNTLPAAVWHFRPMRSGAGAVGALGVLGAPGPMEPDLAQTIDAMLDQAAVAVDRISFALQAAEAEALAESGRFRSALLSSVSHDLRTPLTSILGAVSALRRDPDRYTAAARADLLATIEEEAGRLDRFVANLLDITRIESGAVAPKRDWLPVAEVVDTAMRRMAGRLAGRRVVRHIAEGLPMLRADHVLLEAVLVNLLDNALKHATNATTIEIGARAAGGILALSIADDGEGIGADDLAGLFDKFFRIRRADRTTAGTGLGLSICKGFVEAMGGTILVESPVIDGHGTRCILRFPIEPQPSSPTTGVDIA